MVEDEFFAPIAYRSSKIMDSFFVLGQGAALKKFFKNRLFVKVSGNVLKMEIQMCVEKRRDGMLNVEECIQKAILQSFNPIIPNFLDLSFFRHKPRLADVKIDLSNPAVLSLLLIELSKLALTNGGIKSIGKLTMDNNNIRSLEPFVSFLDGFNLEELDLRFNRIDSLEELRNLRTLRLRMLHVVGNPVESELQFDMGQLKSVLTTLDDIDKNTKFIIDVPKHRFDIEFGNQDDEITNLDENARIIKPENIDDEFKQNFEKYFKINMWSRIYVFHKGNYNRGDILEELTKLVNPYPFYPCYYKYEAKRDSFYVLGHYDAMDVLIKNKLILKIPARGETMGDILRMNIVLNCAEFKTGQLQWQMKINYVIDDRVHSSELNLKNFADDDNFTKIFISFSSRHLTNYVITVASLINGNIGVLNLSGNQITHIDESIPDKFSTIDLSDNCLESLSRFSTRRRADTVHLDRNPLCKEYHNDPLKYLRDVRRVFPYVKILDGLQIPQDIDMATFQNFLVSTKLYSFVEYFIKFYFELYDSDKRIILSHSYDADAILTHYMHGNDDDDVPRKVLHGNESIKNYFKVLPSTLHYLSIMNVDVPFYQRERILIIINGTYVELTSHELFKFSRNLLIEKTSDPYGLESYKFVIKNDLFQSRRINQKSHTYHADENDRKEIINELQNEDFVRQQSQDDEVKVTIIQKATKLTEEKCRKYVEL